MSYWLSRKKVSIVIDLKPAKAPSADMEKMANSMMIRLNQNLNVAIDTDDRSKTVSEILVLKKSDAQRSVSKRIKLDSVEGRFAYQLAASEQKDPKSVMDHAKKANIDSSQLSHIMKLVDKLSDIGYVGASKQVSKKKKGVR